MRPLEGITVIALEHAVAAPFCTRQLADLGARVIKIERPGGGDFARSYDHLVQGMSAYFVALNRSKESLTLDLKHPVAGEVMHKLLAGADVLVQNLAPGAAERLGFGWEALRERYPRLVVCDISGYGDDGPYRDKKAYDLMIQAEAGVMWVTGTPDTPCKVGISIADICAAMYAYSGILSALYQRERAGRGSRVAISMLEALAEWMYHPINYARYAGGELQRTGAMHAAIFPYGSFRAGDGKSLMLAIQNQREWAAFCDKVLGQPELTGDPRFDTNPKRSDNRDVLTEIIHATFAGLSAAQVVERLDAADIANARINAMAELLDHPQLKARDRWASARGPEGDIPMLRPPAVLSECEATMGPVPTVGEHTDRLLAELGYGAVEIQQLRNAAAV